MGTFDGHGMFESIPGLFEGSSYAGIFLLLLLAGLGFPFPEDLTLLGAGMFLQSGSLDLIPTLIVAFTGVLAGDGLLFHMGRGLGSNVAKLKFIARRASPKRMDKMKARFQKWGMWMIVVGRHAPGFRAPIFFTAGALGLRRTHFFLVDTAASFVSIPLLLYLGHLSGENLDLLQRGKAEIQHILMFVGACLLAAYIFIRSFKPKAID